jgi:hypothetical protein
MDAANVDLKAFTEDFYWKICGGHLQPVLDTLIYLKRETQVWFEITTLLIPGENDSDAELEALTQWVMENLGPDVPIHFTAFHPDWKMLNHSPTPPSTSEPGAADRYEERHSLRLHRQCPRREGRQYLLPPVRPQADWPRLVHARRLESDRRRSLQCLWRALRRSVRSAARNVGGAAAAGAAATICGLNLDAELPPRFHAGNFADVFKHVLLIQLIRALQRKDKPFRVFDTHAGAGRYDLYSISACKNREYQGGVGRLWDRQELGSELSEYREQVRALNPNGACVNIRDRRA